MGEVIFVLFLCCCKTLNQFAQLLVNNKLTNFTKVKFLLNKKIKHNIIRWDDLSLYKKGFPIETPDLK